MYSDLESRDPIWPYIGVAACLFGLTVLAPRAWRSTVIPGFDVRGPAVHKIPTRGASLHQDSPRAPLTGPNIDIESLVSWRKPMITEPRVDTGRELEGVETTSLAVADSDTPIESNQPTDLQPLEGGATPRSFAPRQFRASQASAESSDLPDAETLAAVRGRPGIDPAQALPTAESPTDAHRLKRPRATHRSSPKTRIRVPVETIEKTVGTYRVWPYPTRLMAHLAQLQKTQHGRTWSDHVAAAIERVGRANSISAPSLGRDLHQLLTLADQARELANTAPTTELQTSIRQAGYVLRRRALIWQGIHKISVAGADLAPVSRIDRRRPPELDKLEQYLNDQNLGLWNQYLLVDELRQLTVSGDVASCRTLARTALSRIDPEKLNRSQTKLLNASPVREFERLLREWASEPIDGVALMRAIEAYEARGLSRAAQEVAVRSRIAGWSSHEQVARLARDVNVHYRNANLRVAITADLINRLLPEQQPIEQEVGEDILGAWVSGTNQVSTRLKVVLLPDRSQWRIGVEVRGEVLSDTVAHKGPARFGNSGRSNFLARKLLLVDRHGVWTRHAEAGADSETELQWLSTDYDDVPLVGWALRNYALREHENRYCEAQQEASGRVECRASDQLDREVHAQLRQVEREFRDRVLAPMQQLNLDPLALDMQTTSEQLVVRYRLADDRQLAAHTPRPSAPNDSLLSVQIHETALNNTIEQLGLEGRRVKLRALFAEIAETFRFKQRQIPDDIPDDVTIRFAKRDAVRLTFEEGRVAVTLRIAELRKGRAKWVNFAIRAFYLPDPEQLHANLVRDDDGIRIPEGKLRLGQRFALSGIFTRVFSKSRPVNIISRSLAENPAVSDLAVSQFVIRDGWIGVALAPKRSSRNQLIHEVKLRSDSR